jgi:rhodanese-related sulfurtransferase/CBS domain-containing protein
MISKSASKFLEVDTSMPSEIRRKDVKTLVAQGRAQLVEVLPASDYRKVHLPQAINIPLTELNAETTKQLRKDVAVIVYCANYLCDLSARAAWRLESMGFQEVYRYTPGKFDWMAAGLEIEGTNAKKPRLRDMAMKNVPTCALRERMENVQHRRRPTDDICVIVNDRGIVLGMIDGEAWNADPQSRVSEVMNPGPRTFRPHTDPKQAIKAMRDEDIESALVTTADGELLGVIRHKKTQKTHKAA